MKRKNAFNFIIIICIIITSCERKNNTELTKPKPLLKKNVDQILIKSNIEIIQQEIEAFDSFQKTHQIPFVVTQSGIRYYIIKKSNDKKIIKSGSVVTMNYTLALLDSKICYQTFDSPLSITVNHSESESGLQMALQFLKSNEQAIILIPSYLAHGLMGDEEKIPPLAPIIYIVDILKVE